MFSSHPLASFLGSFTRSAAAPPGAPAPNPAAAAAAPLAGEWRKDFSRSDPLEPASSLLQLDGMVRKVVAKMDRLTISVEGGRLRTVAPLPRLLFLSMGATTEEFPLDGAEVEHKRRDNRKGAFTGSVRAAGGSPPGLAVAARWGAPLSGSNVDTYRLGAGGGELTITSELEVEGRRVAYRTVYTRAE